MSSVTLLVIETVICFLSLIILYKKYKLNGIYAYTIIAMIISSLMSLKSITIFNYDLNLGIVPYVSIFTAFNIVTQQYEGDKTKTLLLTSVSTLVISYIIFMLVSYMTSSDVNLFTSASYDNIFSGSLRMYFANIVSLLYSLLLNAKLYDYLKKMKNNIIVSNLFSTIIIHFLSTILFCLIAYIFLNELVDIIKLMMIRYLLSLIIGIIGTIDVSISKYIK